jgi:hypothetical protein
MIDFKQINKLQNENIMLQFNRYFITETLVLY